MFFAIITLITALSMASVAAWFAIAGIMAVFAGAPIPALIMGAVIELGKVVGVSWIYRNWNEKTHIKYTMLPAVLVAMMLTSMGIFGFLSKAHLEQSAPVGNNTAQIERLDQRIAREQSKINDAEQVIAQLDQTVNTLIDYDKISGPDGARAVREKQQAQRDQLATIIDAAEDEISEYQDKKFELSSELRDLELEVGPVKYIAELIYTDAETQLEDAVRLVIIAFIFVFDPMAILLLMGANYSFLKLKGPKDPEDDQDVPEMQDVDSENTPGEGLINLIADTAEEEDQAIEPESVEEKQPDRAWINQLPKRDEDIDADTLISGIRKLKQRDRTTDEEKLLDRFRNLAARRGIPWDIASRASVHTQNELLKQ